MGKAYKSGTYKGLDIAFGGQKGNSTTGAFGGILIRAIHEVNLKTGALKDTRVEGSCTSVNKILELCGKSEIPEFVKHFEDDPSCPSIIQTDSQLYLAPFPAEGESAPAKWVKPVFENPRVGLSLKRAHEHMDEYLMRNYRFHIIPEQMKKGKPQNLAALIGAGKDAGVVARDGSSNAKTVGNAMASVKKGRKMSLSDFIGRSLSGATAFCECYGAWLAAEAAGTLGTFTGKGKSKAKAKPNKSKKGGKKDEEKEEQNEEEQNEEEDEKDDGDEAPKIRSKKRKLSTSAKGKKKLKE